MIRIQHKTILALAIPMILSNITTPLLGMVDTAVMGHLDNAVYMAAVAIGAIVFTFIYWGFGFLRMGTTGMVAQAFGQRDHTAIRTLLAQALLLALILAILLLLLQSVIEPIAFHLINADPQTTHYAKDYFSVRIWSAPATLANYVLLGWFIGMNNTRIPLLFVLWTNIIGIILDLVFVFGFNMTIKGVAWASVIAEYSGLMLGLYCAYLLLKNNPGQWCWQSIVNPQRLRQFFTLNTNIFIRTLCLMFSFAFFTSQGAKQGAIILASNAILLHFQTFMACALDGFANAAEALVGRTIGAKDKAALTLAIRYTGYWSFAIAILATLCYLLFGQALINLLTNIPDVRQTASQYLPWMIITPLIAVWSYWYDGIFIGAMRSKEMRNTMLFATFICYLPVWYVSQSLGNHGLWLALISFMGARGIAQWWVWKKIQLKF